MTNYKDAKERVPRLNTLYFASSIVFFFAIIFALWTLASHAATFLDIPWLYLSSGMALLSPLTLFIAYQVGRKLAINYVALAEQVPTIAATPKLPVFTALLLAAMALWLSHDYWIKYAIILTGFLAVTYLSKDNNRVSDVQVATARDKNGLLDLFLLCSMVALAIIFTVSANRPDLDDASFLQISAQTLSNTDRAPLSFDISLGEALDTFRFAPYRVSSYETLVALISEWGRVSLNSTYYLLLPTITAGLSVLVAFLFSRLLLPSTLLALLATAIFLLLMLAWGETRFAYGNRVFVRLFQGKSLLIALTTPVILICGLLLIHRQNITNFFALVAANICAIGVSSTGLVLTLFTGLLLAICALDRDYRKSAKIILLIGVTLVYPTLLGLWLSIQSTNGTQIGDIGTYVPINSSLGLNLRETIALLSLLVGYALFSSNGRRVECLLYSAVTLVTLNPWLSELASNFTARNMSWRLAWAAPVPLLVSIALVPGLHHFFKHGLANANRASVLGALLSLCLGTGFLWSYNWVTSPANKFKWGKPAHKLAAEYSITKDLVRSLEKTDLRGAVLAHKDIAAWIPLTSSGMRLVMPGHTYGIQLQTVLPRADFRARQQLYRAANGDPGSLYLSEEKLRAYEVEVVIIPSGTGLPDIDREAEPGNRLFFEPIGSRHGYDIFKIVYE